MRLSITYLILFLFATAINAQDLPTEDATNTINQIKLDTCYIWADCTSTKNAKDAYNNAQAVLQLEVQNWLDKQNQADVAGAIMPTKDQYLSIQTMRGKMFRAFIYVDKSQIVPYLKTEKAIVVEHEDVKDDKKQLTKEKKKKEKKKEEPAVEETAIEEAPVVEEAMTETVYTPTANEQKMLLVKKATDIEAFVKSDNISQFGKYRDKPQTGTYYLLIYNPQGEVPACLKFDNGTLTNVSTGDIDSFDNYKGCGAYWFIEK